MAQKYVEQNIHPIKIVQGFARALDDAVECLAEVSVELIVSDRAQMAQCVATCLGTKVMGWLDTSMTGLAIDAVKTVYIDNKETGRKEIDFKRYLAPCSKLNGEHLTVVKQRMEARTPCTVTLTTSVLVCTYRFRSSSILVLIY